MGAAHPQVVDTNVPIATNNRSGNVSAKCQRACIRALRQLMDDGQIALDDEWRILTEYGRNLRQAGQPGPGDAFYKWLLTNRCNPSRCRLVKISPKPGTEDDFEEFPEHEGLADFDPSDRKFVAVAAALGPHAPILQALDSKWWGWRKPLKECGITVRFLCEADIRALSEGRARRG